MYDISVTSPTSDLAEVWYSYASAGEASAKATALAGEHPDFVFDVVPQKPVTDELVYTDIEPTSWWEESGLKIKWGNIFSFRLWFVAFIVAGTASYLLHLLWNPLGIAAFWPVFVLTIMGGMLGTHLYCPHCGKRVKVGMTVCHHCGRDTE